MGTNQSCNDAVCRNRASSHIKSERRVFRVKKYDYTFSKLSILPSNYPREVNQTLMAFKRTKRSACLLKNRDLSTLQPAV